MEWRRSGKAKVPKRPKAAKRSKAANWNDDFVAVESRFADLGADEQAAALEAMVAQAEIQFEASAKALTDTLAGCHPPLILAQVAIHLLNLQGKGRDNAPEHLHIHQHHLELLQAIALRSPLPAPSDSRVATSVVSVLAAIKANAETFALRGLRGRLDDPGTSDLKTTLDQVRGDTQTVRGEFHAAQTERYLRALAKRIDVRFVAAYGVSASAVVDLQYGLLALVERKINLWRQGRFRIEREGKPQRAIKAYAAAFEPGAEAAVKARIAAANVPVKYITPYLVEEAHLRLDTVYSFTLAEARALLPAEVSEAAARRILDAWSLGFGDLADHRFDHLHLGNPVWTKPFIRMPDDVYLWPSPGTLIAFAIGMLEGLIDAVPDLKKPYEARLRGAVLEDELARLVKRVFAGHQVHTKMKWTCDLDGRGYETDAFVVIDRTVLIFEAKAGRVAPMARRGADARLRDTLVKLMADASVQSARLEALLTRRREVHAFTSQEGPARIDSGQIDRVIRYNITFNNLGLLAARWPSLVKAGLISAEASYAPTMSTADLEVVCELLEHPAEIVHYLRRRLEFENNATYLADEYDLIAFYIANGFNIGTKEFGSTFLGLYGMSATLDAWFSRRFPGQKPPPKPRQARAKLWERILATLARRQPPHWLELSHRLLNVEYEPQAMLEEKLPAMRDAILASPKANDLMIAKLHNPTIPRVNPVIAVVYKATAQAAGARLIQAAGEAFIDEIGTKDCLILSFDVHDWTNTYGGIGLMRVPDVEDGPSPERLRA